MGGKFQFSLRQLFLAIAVIATCLGVGKWGYVRYVNRIHPLTKSWELQLHAGDRVSLTGEFHYVSGTSPFQVLWFESEPTLRHERIPVAIVSNCTDGWPLHEIRDGAPVVVLGRLTFMPTCIEFPVRGTSHRCRGGHLFYGGEKATTSVTIGYSISVEEVQDRLERGETRIHSLGGS